MKKPATIRIIKKDSFLIKDNFQRRELSKKETKEKIIPIIDKNRIIETDMKKMNSIINNIKSMREIMRKNMTQSMRNNMIQSMIQSMIENTRTSMIQNIRKSLT